MKILSVTLKVTKYLLFKKDFDIEEIRRNPNVRVEDRTEIVSEHKLKQNPDLMFENFSEAMNFIDGTDEYTDPIFSDRTKWRDVNIEWMGARYMISDPVPCDNKSNPLTEEEQKSYEAGEIPAHYCYWYVRIDGEPWRD